MTNDSITCDPIDWVVDSGCFTNMTNENEISWSFKFWTKNIEIHFCREKIIDHARIIFYESSEMWEKVLTVPRKQRIFNMAKWLYKCLTDWLPVDSNEYQPSVWKSIICFFGKGNHLTIRSTYVQIYKREGLRNLWTKQTIWIIAGNGCCVIKSLR